MSRPYLKSRSSHFPMVHRSAFALAGLLLCSLYAMTAARAAGPLDMYIGAAYGQAHIRAQLNGLSSPVLNALGIMPGSLGGFDDTHSAYQAMVGVRALSFLGAEVTYMDFGQQSIRGPGVPIAGLLGSSVVSEQVSQKGEAAFAMLYLPVPIIDVYAKAGFSRITTDMSATYVAAGVGTCAISNPDCAEASAGRSSTDTAFAYGAGLQWKLGQWAVRGEYERFDAAGANPSLLSIGMTYWLD